MPNRVLSLAAYTARLLPMPLKRALYRAGPLARLLRGVLNQAAPAGLTEAVVAAGELAGARMLLDLQREKDYWLGTYEPNLQRAVRQFVRPGWVAYDVGAGVGYLTLLLARAVGQGGLVMAFEALPANLERLRANLSLNPGPGETQVVPRAVTGSPGLVRFLVHPSAGMGKAQGSAGREGEYRETITVPGVSLDAFAYDEGHPAPQVVKMDIEGGEALALPGMRRLLAEARPLLLLELHGPVSARVAWQTLSEAGYSLHRMTPGYPVIPSPEALEWKSYLVGRPPA